MKKIICAVLASVMSISLFAGCNNKKETEGTTTVYRVEYKNPVHDYIPFVELTVDPDKKITHVNYDWMNANDRTVLKSQDEEYKATWEKVNPDMNQNIARESLAEKLVKSQDVSKVDTVAGATNATEEFKEMVKQLMKERVQKGNKETLIIDNPVEG